MSHTILKPFIVKVSVLGYFPVLELCNGSIRLRVFLFK